MIINSKKKKIKVVTGRVQSGKTTKLFKHINQLQNVDGILALIVNDKRMLYHISSKAIKNLEAESESPMTVSVGRYIFLKESFEWANKKLIESFKEEPEWLIIDEIGKLELRKEGLHKSLDYLFKAIDQSYTNLIIVVRDYLLHEVIKAYNISKNRYEILKL